MHREGQNWASSIRTSLDGNGLATTRALIQNTRPCMAVNFFRCLLGVTICTAPESELQGGQAIMKVDPSSIFHSGMPWPREGRQFNHSDDKSMRLRLGQLRASALTAELTTMQILQLCAMDPICADSTVSRLPKTKN